MLIPNINSNTFLLGLIFFFLTGIHASGQLPVCMEGSSDYIYVRAGDAIYNYDPYIPVSATNPTLNTIPTLSGGNGLAVSPNLNTTTGPSPTFYTTYSGRYYYYDGTNWVNTGHSTGNNDAVNPGAGGGYIYNLVGATGAVYKYDGTGNASLLLTVPGFAPGNGPYDIVTDCSGNFYILRCVSPAWLRKYNPAGDLLQQWDVAGAPSVQQGGGFGIVGNILVFHNTGGLYSGQISANVTTVTVSKISTTGFVFPNSDDMGSCPFAGVSSKDTVFACSSAGVNIRTNGNAPYSYTVVSGTATVTGTGPDFNVKPTTAASIVLHTTSTSFCGGGSDTFLVIPPPIVDAGISDTLSGCGAWLGTLQGTLSNTTDWVNYALNWMPEANIISGGHTVTPVISPTGNTLFILNVTTDTTQGNCLLTDSVPVFVRDESATPDFSFILKPGCDADTVIFTNTSLQTTSVLWDFGDGHTDTVHNPVHIYQDQGIYNVKLIARNYLCSDSITKIVTIQHPLAAGFSQSADSLCQADGTPVQFTDTSVGALHYQWDFGDGHTSLDQNPLHAYSLAGTHQIRLVISDNIPCYDTAVHSIYIDSLPFLHLITDKTEICKGDEINFRVDYLQSSLAVHWDFGDDVQWGEAAPISHSYDREGKYQVTVNMNYPVCPPAEDSLTITVYNFPIVDLGPDNFLCLNGNPIILSNHYTGNDAMTQWKWNTGETTASIAAAHPGTYSLTASLNDCSTTESVVVHKDCYTDIPNAFTPNGDGENDYFFPRQFLSEGIRSFRMSVFSRWGQKIFETTKTDGRGWDGKRNDKEQPAGVYVYQISITYKNGEAEQHTGNVTLIR